MSGERLEAFLAQIYVDAAARERFKADPRGEGHRAGLSEEQCDALDKIDWPGLEMASVSFAKKRKQKLRHASSPWRRFLWS